MTKYGIFLSGKQIRAVLYALAHYEGTHPNSNLPLRRTYEELAKALTEAQSDTQIEQEDKVMSNNISMPRENYHALIAEGFRHPLATRDEYEALFRSMPDKFPVGSPFDSRVIPDANRAYRSLYGKVRDCVFTGGALQTTTEEDYLLAFLIANGHLPGLPIGLQKFFGDTGFWYFCKAMHRTLNAMLSNLPKEHRKVFMKYLRVRWDQLEADFGDTTEEENKE